ncbi:hypothetical protein ACLOJK_021435 [Asimina triloba]
MNTLYIGCEPPRLIRLCGSTPFSFQRRLVVAEKARRLESARASKSDGNGNPVLMIIKGLLRRYERWNPVHPTLGAFWGMGIGLGCGVGWGPGFGPEVVGYVGAGCGIGFSVGITLAGIGIGLPANFLLQIPFNALAGAGTGASEFARSNALPGMTSVAWDGWNNVAPYVSGLKEARRRLPGLKIDYHLGHGINLGELSKCVNSHVKSALESLESLKDRDRQACHGVHSAVSLYLGLTQFQLPRIVLELFLHPNRRLDLVTTPLSVLNKLNTKSKWSIYTQLIAVTGYDIDIFI